MTDHRRCCGGAFTTTERPCVSIASVTTQSRESRRLRGRTADDDLRSSSALFPAAATAGAKLHSLSWGYAYDGYLSDDLAIDAYTHEHDEHLVLVAPFGTGVGGYGYYLLLHEAPLDPAKAAFVAWLRGAVDDYMQLE